MSPLQQQILALADGVRTSTEIAAQVGCNAKHVQNVIRKYGAPSLPRGARRGEAHRDWNGGRTIDHDGYALVLAPAGHPGARATGQILEHRLLAEVHTGRPLLESETVDHIDGLHLHNDPANLRVFATNADHLRATIAQRVPQWSESGWARMKLPPALRVGLERVDTYRLRKARGDVRLLQILLVLSRFGAASPYLLGTNLHLARARIDLSQPTTIERAWAELSQRWEADLAR